MNAVEIEEAVSALAGAPFDRAEFPYAFLAAFGNKDTTIKRLRAGSSNASGVPGGVLRLHSVRPGNGFGLILAGRPSDSAARFRSASLFPCAPLQSIGK
jgi:hypothetical protein